MKKLLWLIGIVVPAVFAQVPHRPLIDSGTMPQVFASRVLSTPYSEWSVSFSPDGKTAYSSMGDIYWTIVYAREVNGAWQQPEVVPFSGRFRDTDPFVTPGGSKLFFISSRPYQPGAAPNVPQAVVHIWYVSRLKNGEWGNPVHLDTAINLNGIGNYAPSASAKGTLYYCSRRKGLTGMQSFWAPWLG
jgi:Tol biopolymer transport system component